MNFLCSRVIAKYLIGKYATNDELYPSDFYKRLEVDKILDFDLGTIFRRATDYFVSSPIYIAYFPAISFFL